MVEKKNAHQIVLNARSDQKITTQTLIKNLFSEFFELHGDRVSGDDPAIITGVAYFLGQPVTVIATDKGISPAEKKTRHFGSPTPAGYRKVLRVAKQAEKFKRPVLFFVNTAGAYPGKSAEEKGQGEALAECLLTLGQLKVPLMTVIFGEGGSGGALALACGDRVYMLENSCYSVLSPEGFAAILWKDRRLAPEATELMQLTPTALLKAQVIDGVIKEANDAQTLEAIRAILEKELPKLSALSQTELLEKRYARFRKF